MKPNFYVPVVATVIALATVACSDNQQSQQPSAPTNAQSAPPSAAGTRDKTTSSDCDMNMDMSKMSAEEHKKMMEECSKQTTP